MPNASNPVAKPDTLGRFPPLPTIFNVPQGLERAYAEAWFHRLLIQLYLDGHDHLIHGHQLTTGAELRLAQQRGILQGLQLDQASVELPGYGTWYLKPRPRLLPPCTCVYELHPTPWCPTHLIDVPGVGQRGAAYTFRIDPFCTHHGEPQYDSDEPWYVDTLGEDERRGH